MTRHHHKLVTVRMTSDERENVKRHARQNGMTVNMYCRRKLGLWSKQQMTEQQDNAELRALRRSVNTLSSQLELAIQALLIIRETKPDTQTSNWYREFADRVVRQINNLMRSTD